MAHFDEEVVKRILVEELKLDSITVLSQLLGLESWRTVFSRSSMHGLKIVRKWISRFKGYP